MKIAFRFSEAVISRIKSFAETKFKRTVAPQRAPVHPEVTRAIWEREILESSMLSDRGKARYMRALQVDPGAGGAMFTDTSVGGITIRDKIAVYLEKGWRPWSMRNALLAGRGKRAIAMAKKGEGTIYRTISEKTPQTAWMNKGFAGAKLIQNVWKKLQKLQQEATRE